MTEEDAASLRESSFPLWVNQELVQRARCVTSPAAPRQALTVRVEPGLVAAELD